jgi:DNA-binding CsgD family transcriptional regulator
LHRFAGNGERGHAILNLLLDATPAEKLGARLWADKAGRELRRVSGRRASGGELTETEERAATMAAESLGNKEIAAARFMGVSTVDAHLSASIESSGSGPARA